MRRNSMGRRGNVGNPGGPLMTGHLQDIDMELELLKRKREMIEQQQQLLVMEQQFKSGRHYDSLDQTRYDEPESHGSNRDFTHLYDNGSKPQNQFGRKRQAEVQWQYEGSFKRSHSKRKSNSSQFNQHGPSNGPANFRNQRPISGSNQGPKFSPKGPAPLMGARARQSIGQKIANQKPKTPQKGFTPTKVSKPKASSAPNKLSSKSPAERKSLVAATSESDVTRMLLPDREPTVQVSGRLELALGALMKNIRGLVKNDSPNASMLHSTQLQRVMKQAVRERIRTVMLGKVVGSLPDILAKYREEFPEETDMDIVNIALEAGGIAAEERKEKTKFIESADSWEFFKLNMNCLVETKLNEMFEKLEEIYGKDAPAPPSPPPPPAEKSENSPAPPTEKSENENPEGEVIDLQAIAEKKKNEPEEKDQREFLNRDIKARDVKHVLPRLMKRCIPYIIKLLNIDSMYQTTKAAITMKANQKAAAIFSRKMPEKGQGDAERAAPAGEAKNEARNNAYNLPYYVKIMGRPGLPKRKVMQTFLSQFNPKSIKKHRTIHNLLFVGFTEKTDFDLMVGADGTVVGRSTLSVRICSKDKDKSQNSAEGQNAENNDSNFAMDISQEEDKKNDSDIINADLDGQITDLLSSIRKSEEEEGQSNAESTDTAVESDKKEAVAEQGENQTAENKTEQEEGDTQGDKVNETDGQDETGDNKDDVIFIEENNEDKNNAEVVEIPDETETQDVEQSNDAEAQKSETIEIPDDTNETENSVEANNSEPTNGDAQKEQPSQKTPTEAEQSEEDKITELKTNASGRSTPSRNSARLANVTPSTIRTRRASRLAQN